MSNDFSTSHAFQDLVQRVEALERERFRSPPPAYSSSASSETGSLSSSDIPFRQPTESEIRANANELGSLRQQLRAEKDDHDATKKELLRITNELNDLKELVKLSLRHETSLDKYQPH